MTEDTLGRSAEEQGLTDEQVIARRTAEHERMVKQFTPPAPAEPTAAVATSKAGLDAILAEVAARANKPTNDARAAERAEGEAAARPLIEEAHALQTRHGILAKKHLAAAQAVNATDWRSLFAAVPAERVFDEKSNRMVSKNHAALRRLQQAAADAVTMLGSSFGDSMPSLDDLVPVSLPDAVNRMEAVLARGASVTSAAFRAEQRSLV